MLKLHLQTRETRIFLEHKSPSKQISSSSI